MKITYASDRGRVRADNQDYVDVFVNTRGSQLAIVADGVGGEFGGDVASTMAVLHLGNEWRLTDVADANAGRSWLEAMAAQENTTILNAGRRYRTLKGMATTLVVAIILADQVIIANLGDSRAYLLRNRELRQITEDHNLAGELFRQGAITADQAAEHPGRHIITRSLGVGEDVALDIYQFALQVDDLLLLTTDGLPKVLSDKEIVNEIENADSQKSAVENLIKNVNAGGGPDNVTVLLGYQENEGQI
ncbi:serine/threonine-protein phosphatase 1 [Weissella oryzae SG25]|uniref:Serine/threonine-protein phosphatase 1 n=1 Tax=Weissella oryzae (strain DSM 25784 / JCM 18191 / LMG 30913 / SG25) TaxID=1329250 RepID=A0A069CZZ2_WEIOS|nr:Stp1/IreP family PP2C-type Ser/Thr phosphatase [Weissella oryzae]GAK30661.1 serine/threonine-protein phosphatase 1 [Weissella oryzae SG25]